MLGMRNGVQQWVIDWVLEYKVSYRTVRSLLGSTDTVCITIIMQGSLYGTGTNASERVDLTRQKAPTAEMAGVLADGNSIARAKAASGVITEEELKRIEEINRRAAEAGIFTAPPPPES